MYKLNSEVLGVMSDRTGKQVAISVPAESMLEIVGDNQQDGTVDVVWDGRLINVFAVDLDQRAKLIGDRQRDSPTS